MARNSPAWAEQALALHQAGRLKEAALLYDRALAQRPKDAALLGLAGALQLQLGKAALAAKLLRRSLAERPGDADTLHNLGFALLKLGEAREAAAHFASATRLAPDSPAAWMGLGQALRAQVQAEGGETEGAVTAFRRVLALAPDHAAAMAVLGALLDQAGEAAEAEPLLRRAVELQPGQASWRNGLGLALHHLKRSEAAEAAYREALRLDPELDAALSNLGRLLLDQRRGAEAKALLEAGFAAREAGRRPVSAELLAVLLDARMLACDWRGQEDLRRRILAAGGELPHLLYHEIPPARFRQTVEALVAAARRPALPAPLPRKACLDVIRLGYLSNDFHAHATAYLLAEVLERHDRARFHVTAYSTGPEDGSAMRERLRVGVDAFQDVAALADAALVERIAEDGIELLVDLKGWTEGSRLSALAWRPAPVQVAWLGYPGTLGAPWVDYAIVDPVIAPPGADAHFTEALIRLPDCYQPNDRLRQVGLAPGRAEVGLPPDGLVLACFCHALKITPEVFGIWMRALAASPGAVLWLLEAAPEAMAHLRREAAARGIDPARLVFAPKLPQEAHLARYRVADLALDTFPCGSHTTASDALWAGCPQLAIMGEAFAGRVSTSIVTAMGLPELAAADLVAHEAMLLGLCADAPARAALREKIEQGRTTAALFDTPRFLRHLEAAYAAVIERHRAGMPPAPISIAPLA
jgi:predicted O-linked N-acetylglucosamine transferase (SPINDLY family)